MTDLSELMGELRHAALQGNPKTFWHPHDRILDQTRAYLWKQQAVMYEVATSKARLNRGEAV